MSEQHSQPTVDHSAPLAPRGALRWSLILVGGGTAWLLALGLGLVAGRFTAPAPVPASSTIVRSTPSIIVAVRDLARLEGASMHVERVIDLRDRQSRLFGLLEAEDAIILVAAGDVTAGVDLGKLAEGDVVPSRDTRSVVITLPSVEILSVRLDNQRTYVHARNTDLLARRRETLESKARKEAELTLQESAKEAELFARAQRSITKTVSGLARALGYQNVTIRFASQS